MQKIELADVRASIKKLKHEEKSLRAKLKHVPSEKLKCLNKGNYSQYYIDGKYANKSAMSKIIKLAERDYYKALLPVISEKIKVLERIEEAMMYDFAKPDKVYEGLSPGRKKLVAPFIMTTTEYIQKWQNEEYDHWIITDDDVRGNYITSKGERVRSKSEKIIADELTRHNIPYRYEYPLVLRDGARIVTKRPDFMALNPNSLKIFIIEHLGLLDKEMYSSVNFEKIDLYERNGYLLGKNLLIFHETSNRPLDVGIVNQYITEYLM